MTAMFRNLVVNASCLMLLAVSQCHGAVILENTFTGATNGDSPFSAGQTTDANVTSVGVGREGYTRNGGFNELVAGELRTPDGAIRNFARYFSFDVTPINGAIINFTDFQYSGNQNIAAGGTNGATKFDFRSSLDGFSASIPGATLAGGTISLADPSFQGVTAPIAFRLFIQSDTTDESPNSTYDLHDFQFNGTVVVAVPEPSSLALLAISGCVMIAGRRRRNVIA